MNSLMPTILSLHAVSFCRAWVSPDQLATVTVFTDLEIGINAIDQEILARQKSWVGLMGTCHITGMTGTL